MKSSNIKVKIAGGFILGPIVLYIIACGDYLLLALAAFTVTAGLIEFYGLLRGNGMRPIPGLGIPLGLIFLVAAYAWPDISVSMIMSAAVITALFLQLYRSARGGAKHTISDLSVTIFGSVYFGALLGIIFNLKQMYTMYYSDAGAYNLLTVLPLAGAWASDAGALFAGKAVGSTPLAPKISPNKTVEGAVGGLAAATAFSVLICSMMHIGVFHSIIIGLLIGAFGQLGDLSESAFKRQMDVKDTGTMIIGAGGLMDRADSILFSIPATYFYLKLFVIG